MADPAFFTEFVSGLVRPAFLVFRVIAAALCVHQIEVEIVDAAGFKLRFKERADVLLRIEKAARQLIGQEEFAAVMTPGDAFADRRLGLAADVRTGRIEIVEAGLDKGVRHAAELLLVDRLVFQHGQAHAAEAEIAADLGEKRIVDHGTALLSCSVFL